ncbi:5'-nucleotidase C-terminal domain-containing protein [Hazenella sp. IB182357]|uniref:5'-nucleotidase C-terminal domain-containing protein n=1 Tax=Polycladospora coralii TaxID=2771432 RepID=A0A926N7E6_9BACL|nr:5'-nucleotidase C-terminal domain-containing protein [Polycladospora coralii]MBD1370808.1 5'-nucleotidase C-terminal domain-containing protein [Polycladospora coralii]MBS7529747.1 5'-nucleotidase C-terminal domain-containing protein [Polycladospora coralii]
MFKRSFPIMTLAFITIFVSPLFIAATPYGKQDNRYVDLQLIGLNDFHGQLDTVRKVNDQPVGTAPILARYIKEREKAVRNSLIVTAGDMVGASSPTSSLLQDEPTVDFFNQIGVDVGGIGNHEFDEGVAEMKRLIYGGYHEKTGYYKGAKFPYICANVVDNQTGKHILPPSTIKKVDGIKVGFIGIVTQTTPSVVIPEHVKSVTFTDEADAVNREVKRLKKKGVEAIIVLAHEGGKQTDDQITGPIKEIVEKMDDEVDVVFAGHSHSVLNGKIGNKLVVQSYSYGTAFADVDLVLDRKTKDIIQKKSEIVTTFHEGKQPHKRVQKIVDRAKKRVEPIINQEIGQAAQDITKIGNEAGESALGNLIADSQRVQMGTDFAFMNPGGIRADINKGAVTWGDLYTVQPFGNDLVKMELTGKQIRQLLNQQWADPNRIHMLQISGFSYTWDESPSEDRILSLKKTDGTTINDTETYTVTANAFLAGGGDNFTVFKEAKNKEIGPVDLDAIISYIKQQPQPFTADIEGRIQKYIPQT